METFISDISQNEFPINDKVEAWKVSPNMLEFIKNEHPAFGKNSCLSTSELNLYREKYISEHLMKEIGELSDIEKTVLSSVSGKTILTDQIDGQDNTTPLSFGQRIADKVADFGGSWTFILSFIAFLVAWIAINVFWFANKGFDPYPFILLNLILSCVAALQAPIIMMSQNRQEEKDRDRAKKDYMINLKSELEIRLLHEKIDHLIMHQQQTLLEIQKDQIEKMDHIIQNLEKKK